MAIAWHSTVGKGGVLDMKQQGVTVCCEDCTCTSTEGNGAFNVRVPVRAGGTEAMATLRCLILPERHCIDLVGWELAQGTPEASDVLRHKVSTLLGTIAEKRVCGSARVCPAQVISMVEHGA
jgi:hypothetical protein